jgi:hypothetical protein
MANRQREEEEFSEPRFIPRKEPIKIGNKLRLDFKIGWGFVVILIGALAVKVAGQVGKSYLGWLFAGAFAALVAVLVVPPLFDGGRTTPLGFGFRKVNKLVRDKRGTHRYLSGRPLTPELVGQPEPDKWVAERLKGLKRIGAIRVIAHETQAGPLAIVHDRSRKTYLSTLTTSGPSMLSMDNDTRETQLDAFARVLDSLTDTYMFAWQQRTLRKERLNSREMVSALRSHQNLAREDPPNLAVLLDRTKEMAAESVTHEVTMTLALYGPHIKVSRKVVNPRKQQAAREKVLVDRLRDFYALLQGSGYGQGSSGVIANFMTYNQMVMEIRRSLDPVGAERIEEQWRGPADDFDLLEERLAFPETADFETSSEWVRLGDTFHKGFYLERFARNGLRSDHFWKVLRLEIPKTVSVVVNTLSPGWAQHRAEWATNAASLANRDRLVGGGRVTERADVQAGRVRRHERELAEEKGLAGEMAVYIDLPGASLEEVQENEVKLMQAAKGADFIVLSLTSRQHLGIDACLPLARGMVPMPVLGS